jgi:SPP1 gp7 family putative phage head morphogenesis protein
VPFAASGLHLLAADPTRTKTLRDAWTADVKRRFRKLKQKIRHAILEDDVLELRNASRLHPIKTLAFKGFTHASDKVDEFMSWLNEQEDLGILEVQSRKGRTITGSSAWQNKYIDHSYRQGLRRANQELKKIGVEGADASDQNIRTAFARPFHADRVGLLYTRAFTELRGITEAMDRRISQVLADHLARGDGPRVIARDLANTVNGIGRNRAILLARTETIRAHHEATINTYEEAGVLGVSVKAEFRTAGDSRVCEICFGLEAAGPYTLEQIRPMIPAHPLCRCVALPLPPGVEPIEELKPPKEEIMLRTRPAPSETLTRHQIGSETMTRKDGTTFERPIYEWRGPDGKPLTGDLLAQAEALKVPPGWSNAKATFAKDAKYRFEGYDAVGRLQRRRSEIFIAQQDAKKFARVRQFSEDLPIMRRHVMRDQALGRPEAFLFEMEDRTAIRIGSTTDFKAKKKAYGLTTLQGRHAMVRGDEIHFAFIAKEGKVQQAVIKDRALAKWVAERKAAVGPRDPLWPDVSAQKLNSYVKEVSAKNYTVKDFRTHHATRIAHDRLAPFSGNPPTGKEKKALVKEVLDEVSGFLNNTPSMAKRSYIDPSVWEIIGGAD